MSKELEESGDTDITEDINNGLNMEEHVNSSNYNNDSNIYNIEAEQIISEEVKEALENSELYKTASEMTDEIIALTNRLDEQFKKKEDDKAFEANSKVKKNKYHIGALSAAFSLIYAGIALIYGLSVQGGVLLALRFSPVILVCLGLEIIVNIALTRSNRIKLDLYSLALSAGIIILTCVTSSLFINMTNSEITRDNIEKRLESEMNLALTEEFVTLNKLTKLAENEILIGNIETDISLYGENLYDYKNVYDILESDTVNIKVYFNVAQKTLVKFAEDCVKTLEVLDEVEYYKHSIGNVEFIGTDRGDYIHVSLNKKLQSHIGAVEIAKLADYFAENLVTDTEDLIYAGD